MRFTTFEQEINCFGNETNEQFALICVHLRTKISPPEMGA